MAMNQANLQRHNAHHASSWARFTTLSTKYVLWIHHAVVSKTQLTASNAIQMMARFVESVCLLTGLIRMMDILVLEIHAKYRLVKSVQSHLGCVRSVVQATTCQTIN